MADRIHDFQFHHLLAEFSALENIMLPALIAGRPRSEASDRAAELLAEVASVPAQAHLRGHRGGRRGRAAGVHRDTVASSRRRIVSITRVSYTMLG